MEGCRARGTMFVEESALQYILVLSSLFDESIAM